MGDHALILLDMIDRALVGNLGFDDFARTYYTYYTETLREEALTQEERAFLSTVQEKLDWTMTNPDPESRRFGWIDPSEYLRWLGIARSAYAPQSGRI